MELFAESAVTAIDRGRSTPARSSEERIRQTRSRMAVWVRSPMTGIRKTKASSHERPFSDRRMDMYVTMRMMKTLKITYHQVEMKLEKPIIMRVGRGSFAWNDLKKTTKRGSTNMAKTPTVTTDMHATTIG